MAFKVPEQYRDLAYSTQEKDGNNGVFWVPGAKSRDQLKIIASNGLGWEHISISKKYECPTWSEMCYVKSLFWGEEDTVIQYHPAKSEYVNNHPYCLHLWRPIDQVIPIPDSYLVGLK